MPTLEYAVVFDALLKGMLQLLRGSTFEVSMIHLFNSSIFLGEMDIIKTQCSNKYVRNLMQYVTVPPAKFFRTLLYGEIVWKKIWLVWDKFCLNNKVKEVSFKIMHQIYPAKKTLERFKIDIEYSCDFCGLAEESICHLFYHCTYTRMLWVDVGNYIRRKTKDKDVFICFENNEKEELVFFVQLILLLGKFHIH